MFSEEKLRAAFGGCCLGMKFGLEIQSSFPPNQRPCDKANPSETRAGVSIAKCLLAVSKQLRDNRLSLSAGLGLAEGG